PILKWRIFGITNSEGNHGEDAKELYYYLDATPTHSYLKMLYKYPQQEFPYARLVDENARRKGNSSQAEFELLDTGIFDDDRYFDVFVEYAKAGAVYKLTIPAGGSISVRLRLVAADPARRERRTRDGDGDSTSSPRRLPSFADFDDTFATRLREADEFYGELQQDIADADARNV